jgi:hypothetical protein
LSSAKRIEVYTQRRNESVWKLLAADNAPMILGILQTQLFEQDRVLTSAVFHERMSRELENLRSHGWSLPQTAQNYIADWLNAGYLERIFPKDATEEVYELTSSAISAIQFIDGLGKKHRAATQSRLSLVISQLAQLAEQTDDDPKVRIAQLKKDRARIDAEINDIQKGKIKVLNDQNALEQAREIIVLAQELIHDFRYVRDNFQQLNRNLREQIVESDGSRGEVLAKLFSGVDVVKDSEAGRSFSAFWRLLTNPEQSMLLEEATEQVLSRAFAKKLEIRDRKFLLKLTRELLDQGGVVHDVLQFFARSLKHFVQSRAYQEQRRLIQLLREAQREALALKNEIRPTDTVVPEFYLTSARAHSSSQLSLLNPEQQYQGCGIQNADAISISLETVSAWVAQSEINFRLINQHIAGLLGKYKQISIAQIIEIFPAEQGLGTIVGYLALGARFGVLANHHEIVSWKGVDNILRTASIPCIYFLEEKRHEFINA